MSPPAKGTQVYSGDVIITGESSFVSLKVSSAVDVVNVQSDRRNTLWGVGSLNTTETGVVTLNLDDNCQILSDVSSQNNTTAPVIFTVRTPFHNAAVRGPLFVIDADLVPIEDIESNR